MKKIFLLLGLLLTISVSYAQEQPLSTNQEVVTNARKSANHISFKGVPLKGSLNKFVKKMQEEGFRNPIFKDNWVTMEDGSVAGLDGCSLSIYGKGKRSTVYSVCVRFANQKSWESLYYNYIYLKVMLTKKYGEPDKCVEDLHADGSLTDKDAFLALSSGEYVMISNYNLPEGSIALCIESLGYGNNNFVTLTYTDFKNSEPIREEYDNEL